MSGERGKGMARGTLAVVDGAQRRRKASMLGVACRAGRLLGTLRLAHITTSEKDMRGMGQAFAARRIVTPLAAQSGDLVAGFMALDTLEIDPRVVRRHITRRQGSLEAGDI